MTMRGRDGKSWDLPVHYYVDVSARSSWPTRQEHGKGGDVIVIPQGVQLNR